MSNSALILSILALFGAFYCYWEIRSLSRLKKIFLAGSQDLDLESILLMLEREQKTSRYQQKVLEEGLAELKNNFNFAIQKVGLVRFNPFQDGGGNFSFSLALLDNENSGVILTSMHGRQQNRIYTKKIENGKSDSQLTEEEFEAVQIAHSKTSEKTPKSKKPKS